jgi:hypothetical protein
MEKKKVIEPLDMVRNIVNEIDAQIHSVQKTINFISKEDDTEIKETLLVEYKSLLEVLTNLRNFVIYKA